MPAYQAESLAGDYAKQIEEELRRQKEKLKELIDRRKRLKEEIIEITKQIDENMARRNDVNQQIKKIKEDIAQLRVSEKNLKDEIERKRVVVKSRSRKIRISEREARAQLSKLEWRLATEHLDPKEEAELVREIERARMLLREVESIISMRKKMEDFENKIEEIKSMIIQKNSEKAKLVETSNLYHAKIKELLEERKIKRDELSRLDAEIEEARKKKDELFMKMVEIDAKSYLAKMRHILMLQEEQAKRLKIEEAIKSKLALDAQEKLKRGETLDWEEFKALIEAQGSPLPGR
ncbi:MAG: hypothetical protein FGF52_02045 [Candidatus Brockarchaeota archaeon]|nr:hypothetical protein [Candidatus Brockarchaeota archaeon]